MYEPETERTYSAENPEDIVDYAFHLITSNIEWYSENWSYWFNKQLEEAQPQPSPQPREGKGGSRGAGKSSASKRVHQQVLRSACQEAPSGGFDWRALSQLRKEGKY